MEKSVPLGFRLPALLFPLLFFVPALPPFVDYPQHMALAGALRRLGDPASFAHTLYEANLFTYNGLFDELAALASSFMPGQRPPYPLPIGARLRPSPAFQPLDPWKPGSPAAAFERQRRSAVVRAAE